MKKITLLLLSFGFWASVNAQNIGINTTGNPASTLNMLEVLQISTTANSVGIYSNHSGNIAGTGYGLKAITSGTSTTNVAGYFSATGATNNYAGIFEDGFVGIGTTAPGARLDVQAGAAGQVMLLKGAGSSSGFASGLTGGTHTWELTTADAVAAQATRILVRGATNTAAIEFYSGARGAETETARIHSDGNVGIGTTAPSTKLHIDFDAPSTTLTGTTAYGGIHLDQSATADEFTGITTSATSTGTQGGILFQGSGAYGTKIHFLTTNSYAAGMAQRMIIDHVGNVGIGVTAPAYQLELGGTFGYGDGTAGSYRSRTESRADAGLIASQSGFYQTSAPSPAANWPVGAASWWHLIDCRHSNNTNNYAMQFSGSFFNQDLYFRKTNNNAAQAWVEVITTANGVTNSCGTVNYLPKMTTATNIGCSQIFDNGTNVGIGTAAPTYKLHVNGRLKTTGINETSDIRLKKNILPLENALSKVQQLRGVSYEWRADEFKDKGLDTAPQIGLIAQEVEKIFPQLVGTDNLGFKSVEYSKMVAVLIEAIKDLSAEMQRREAEQDKIISGQKAEINFLNGKVNGMEKDIDTLKASFQILLKQNTSVADRK